MPIKTRPITFYFQKYGDKLYLKLVPIITGKKNKIIDN